MTTDSILSTTETAALAIAIAGAGRMAQALGRLLHERGERVAAVASRDPGRARTAANFIGGGAAAVSYASLPEHASRILIAVSDDALEAVAGTLARAGMAGGAALHTCGAQGPEALALLAARGVSCGVIHPLQTVATPEQGCRALPDASFGIAGEGEAGNWARRIVALLGGQALEIAPGRHALYHAAAVMASNCVVGIVDAAVMLMSEAGVEEKRAFNALAPLVRASCENALTLGPLAALTGPIERGDADTVRRHWNSLGGVPAPLRDLYRCAALYLLGLAQARGLPATKALEIERVFSAG